MARHEEDREDLMNEATALEPRVELQIPGCDAPVIMGVRSEGRLSVYFGADPVYQFEADGSLRRAYVDGLLYRTQGETLAELRKVRAETTSQLHRRDLVDEELAAFLNRMRGKIAALSETLRAGMHGTLQCVPCDATFPDSTTCELLDAIAHGHTALAPAINMAR